MEFVLTLGTGLGTALLSDGVLFPCEDLVRDSELKRIGPVEWTGRVLDAVAQLEPIFNYDMLHLGGGNVRHLTADLPDNVRVFSLGEALRGALKLWDGA